MSINAAMQSGVTALAANATALATISNNIANSNTAGFKRVLTNFTDLVSGTGSNKNAFSSGGVVAVNRQAVTNQGELNSNTAGYSLGIDGQGFFVVSDGTQTLSSGSSLLFSRDGSFTPDTEGNLVNAGGFYLEGWPADTSGNITTSATDVSLLAPINVTNVNRKPEASTAMQFKANLNAATPVSTGAATYNASTSPMSTYATSPLTSTKPDSTISASISDSLGQEHSITISLIKMPTSTVAGQTQWSYEISSPDVTSGGTPDLHQIGTGSLFFDSNGNMNFTDSTGPLFSGYTIAASGATGAVGTPAWNSSVGAGAQTISMGFNQTTPASSTSVLTQTTGDSTTTSIKANGTEFGTLSKVEIGKNGLVTAIYNNGNTRVLAQVAVATFLNANGLTSVTGNAYQVSTDSGAFSLKTPGSGGSGTIEANTLEASTVDLAQEFTGLITTQRAYSAASKIVTTADEMLQELLSIKR
ncbi:flagellar hook-basal body complex protein [Asticcacaulis sp. 201]|uniref:flagellar hook protein FlgE n=1 Tax=Asticcacaulis sp. 201 TaxID=3028787 RepID=UPI002915FC74|nr:flagellar hook-basal body complex protein [Asticcacaulis sp. 201]MDV6331841.1 flagellar hook-basal body complex protein [Asticcacaulis sp. 201]